MHDSAGDGVASDLITSNTIKTLDFAIPVIAGFSPSKGASDVAIDKDIVITFSEDGGSLVTVKVSIGMIWMKTF